MCGFGGYVVYAPRFTAVVTFTDLAELDAVHRSRWKGRAADLELRTCSDRIAKLTNGPWLLAADCPVVPHPTLTIPEAFALRQRQPTSDTGLFKPRPRRGRTPPAVTNQRAPCLR